MGKNNNAFKLGYEAAKDKDSLYIYDPSNQQPSATIEEFKVLHDKAQPYCGGKCKNCGDDLGFFNIGRVICSPDLFDGYTGKKKEICASSMSSVCCNLQHVHYFFMEDGKFYEYKFEHVYPDKE